VALATSKSGNIVIGNGADVALRHESLTLSLQPGPNTNPNPTYPVPKPSCIRQSKLEVHFIIILFI